MSKDHVVCPSCGFSNQLPLAKNRCVSCGAVVEEAPPTSTHSRPPPGQMRQARFSPLWFLIAIGITTIMTAAIVMGLPMVARPLDFEGYAGMMVAVPVWFASGVLVGMISPGRTFMEPAIATLMVAVPTAFLLFKFQTVKTMPFFVYLLMGALGVLFALVGAYVGERMQLGPDKDLH